MNVFVGRTEERARLATRIDNAVAGSGGVVFITGEAGAGKTALIEQVRAEARTRHPDLLVLHAACSEQYGTGEPYQPFVESLRHLLRDAGEEGSRWSHLRQLAAELAPTWLSAIPLAGNLLAATLNTAVELRRLGSGARAAASEEALFFQYTEAMLAAASERAVLQVLDDLHWADGASVSLLAHIARRISGERLLLVGTYRAADVDATRHPIREARLELHRYGLAEDMALSPLDRNALRELAVSVLGGPPTRDLLEWVESRAGANPLYFRELLGWCVSQGITSARDGQWNLERVPEALEVPPSAEAAIERRLQRLDPDTYRTLEYASVQGDDFSSTVLAKHIDADELAVEEQLDTIARTHRLVEYVGTNDLPDGDITSVYRFGHSLIQAVLHGHLQGKRRILVHRRMVEILEGLYGDESNRVAHRLAVHCDEGRLPERAFRFALAGADSASRVYAHRDAIALIMRALRNAATDAQRMEALGRLGEENRVVGKLAESQQSFQEALRLAEAEADELAAIALERRLLSVRRQLSLPREQLETELNRVVARAQRAGATGELCRLLLLWSNLPGLSADDAAARCREALPLADASEDPELRTSARYALGRTLALGPDPSAGLAPLADCLERNADRDRSLVAKVYNVLGIIHVKLGDYRAAAGEFEAAATTFDEIVDPANEALVLNNLCVLLTRLGDWEAAEAKVEESLRISRRMGAEVGALHPLENRASLAEARGEWSAALDRWTDVAERARAGGWWNVEVIARAGAGRAHIALGDVSAAGRECEQARALIPEGDAASEAAVEWHMLAARLAAAHGDAPEAAEKLDLVEPTLASRDRYEWAAAQVLRAELLGSHDPGAARAALEDAVAILEHMGTQPLLQRARALSFLTEVA